MSKFRTRPSSRREPRPTAVQLILGPDDAKAVARGDITLHMRPVTGRDHRKRYHVGQRLAVRPSMGAATLCHVNVTEVRGPTFDPAPMRLADITFDDALHAGRKTTLDLKRAWLVKHDTAWVGRHPDGNLENAKAADDIPDEDIDARWDRHAHKPVWAIRFVLDLSDADKDRFMASRYSINSGDYVSTIARALDDDPAVDEQTQQGITSRAGMQTVQWQALEAAHHDERRKALSLEQRITFAVRKARQHGVDVTRELWMVRTAQNQKKPAQAIEKRVEILERKAFTAPMRRAA